MKQNIQKLHPLESLGVITDVPGRIRAERLEHRFEPKVPFPHKHDFFHILMIQKGSGWHEIDFKRYSVKAGQIFVMKPGQVHSWVLNPKSTGFIIEFASDGLLQKELVKQFESISDQLSLDKKTSVRVLETCVKMSDEFKNSQARKGLALQSYLAILLVELERHSPVTSKSNLSQPTMSQFLHLIESHFHNEHRVEFYARELKITPKALTMRATREFGKAARDMILDRALLEAKRLLAYSPNGVSEVGANVGFEDPNYFARFFRKRCGLTPAAFRKRTKALK